MDNVSGVAMIAMAQLMVGPNAGHNATDQKDYCIPILVNELQLLQWPAAQRKISIFIFISMAALNRLPSKQKFALVLVQAEISLLARCSDVCC